MADESLSPSELMSKVQSSFTISTSVLVATTWCTQNPLKNMRSTSKTKCTTFWSTTTTTPNVMIYKQVAVTAVSEGVCVTEATYY